MLVDQIYNEKIVVHCRTTQYQVLRISKTIQNKTILYIMLVDQIYNEKSMYFYRKINPQAKLT